MDHVIHNAQDIPLAVGVNVPIDGLAFLVYFVIGWFQIMPTVSKCQHLSGDFLLIETGDDYLTDLGGVLYLDHHEISIEDTTLDHTLTLRL